MESQAAFTLAEAMVVLALIGILLAVTVPSFVDLIATTQTKAAASDFHATLLLARSEAAKRNARTQVVAANGGWSGGWQTLDANENVIQVNNPHELVSVDATVVTLSFDGDGRLTGGGRPSFEFFAVSERGAYRCVQIGPAGRPYVSDGECP